ncbi:hypothetical protein [Novosphingobium sp. B 225]|uniref:hypothetical protein n=1 Tax=Novosphingobium sp. B 225 TaxID=1961849 RepID=UPI000B4B6120|nr:hypothetical protein [Novosphingobium sp. B 225]
MKLTALFGAVPLALAFTAAAQAGPVKVQGGTLTLPTTGIVITVADDPARDYMLGGSWSLSDSGSYDARDVVDELAVKGGALVRGNWILTGFFDAGNCDALIAALKVSNGWSAPHTLWGKQWQAGGGDYAFTNSIGTRPMVALCRTDKDGRGLLLQHFLIDRPAGMAKAAMLTELGQARILAAAAKGYAARSVQAPGQPGLGNVTNRGKNAAARTVRMELARIEFDLPDDGQFWIVTKPEAGKPDQSDRLDRLLPSMPDVSVEVARVPGTTCDKFFGMLKLPPIPGPWATQAAKPVVGVPAGWSVGPVTALETQLERMFCKPFGKDVLLAGYMAEKYSENAAPIAPLLNALAKARSY